MTVSNVERPYRKAAQFYNFTGPQGFGIANMADSLYAIRQLVYEEKKFTMEELKEALAWNYGKGLDEQSVKEITTGILREMTESGAKLMRILQQLS